MIGMMGPQPPDDLDKIVATDRRLTAPDMHLYSWSQGAEAFHRHPPGGSFSGWMSHMARYLISDDYAPQFLTEKGALYQPDNWATTTPETRAGSVGSSRTGARPTHDRHNRRAGDGGCPG